MMPKQKGARKVSKAEMVRLMGLYRKTLEHFMRKQGLGVGPWTAKIQAAIIRVIKAHREA